MKLLHVIDSLRLGGAQSVVLRLAGEYLRLGTPFEVLALSEPSGSHFERDLAALGVPVHFAPPMTGFGLIDPRLRGVRRIVSQGGFDVVHSHLDYATVATALATLGLDIPTVVTLHSSVSSLWEQGRARRAVLRWATGRMSVLIACGEAVASDLPQAADHRRLEVIANPAPGATTASESERRDARRELVSDEVGFAAITVSRLDAVKRIDCVIDAVAERRRAGDDMGLAIIGEGDQRAALEEQVRRRDLQSSVRFLGQRVDVARLLHGADAFLCPSEHEGMPMSVLEAMSVGLPVVATPVGDLEAVLADGRGIVIDAPDPRSVSVALAKLAADRSEGRRIGRNAQQWVTEHRSIEGWVERTTGVYESLLEDNGRPAR